MAIMWSVKCLPQALWNKSYHIVLRETGSVMRPIGWVYKKTLGGEDGLQDGLSKEEGG